MRLERIERTGTRGQVLREYQRRGMLVERGLPLIREMCDDGTLSDARLWLRIVVDERPASDFIAPVSTLITKTTGGEQSHQPISEPLDLYTSLAVRDHALSLWFDLFMHTWRKMLPFNHWHSFIDFLLPKQGEYFWIKQCVVLFDYPSVFQCWRPDPQGPGIIFRTDAAISFDGVVYADAWCPPLPAFDHNLNAVLTTAG